jgi:hypothetical protein
VLKVVASLYPIFHDKGLMIDKLKERMFLEGNKEAEASERNRH